MKKIFTFIAALLIAAGVGAQSAAPPTITLTTAKAVGETIKLNIWAQSADQAGVWIDLNNNGVKDEGEAVTAFNYGSGKTYTLGAKTVTLHGKVTYLDCDNNRLTALDVSKNTALEGLVCYYNQLTALDISKNTELTGLICLGNRLTTIRCKPKYEINHVMVLQQPTHRIGCQQQYGINPIILLRQPTYCIGCQQKYGIN